MSGADAEHRRSFVIIFVEIFREEGLAPRGIFTSEERHPARALHRSRHGYAAEFEERRREVDVQDHFVHGLALGKEPGVADEQGDAERFFVERPFVAEAVLAEVVAVVAGVDDDGVVGEAEFVEGLEQAAEIFVGSGDVAKIVQMGCGHWRSRRRRAAAGGSRAINGRAGEIRHGPAQLAGELCAQALGEIRTTARAVGRLEAEDH